MRSISGLGVVALCALGVPVALGACSSSGSSSTPSTTSAVPTPSAVATTAAVGATAPPGPAPCATSQLAVSMGAPNGSAGHANYEIAFRNTSPSACTLAGYPGVSFLDASGSQIGVPAARSGIGPTTALTIQPGSSGYAHLSVVDPGVATCAAKAASQLKVFPPGQTVAVTVPLSIQVCSDQTPPGTIDRIASTAP